MILERSIVVIADNTGAKIGRIFKVLGAAGKRYAGLGERVVLSVQKAEPRKQLKKKDVVHAVVVRTVRAHRRADGSYIRFDENAVVVVDKTKNEPLGNRVFGPIPREVADAGFSAVSSKAAEVV